MAVSITGVAPAEGLLEGGTTVVISGSGFEAAKGGGSVGFSGVGVNTYNSWADGKISVQSPPGVIPAVVNVKVTNDSAEADTSVGAFTYLASLLAGGSNQTGIGIGIGL